MIIVKKKRIRRGNSINFVSPFHLCFGSTTFSLYHQVSVNHKLVQRRVALDASNVLVTSDFTLRSFIFSSSTCIFCPFFCSGCLKWKLLASFQTKSIFYLFPLSKFIRKLTYLVAFTKRHLARHWRLAQAQNRSQWRSRV